MHGPEESAAVRLATAKATPDCLSYYEDVLNGYRSHHSYRIAVYGIWRTGEIFVEMTDGRQTRVSAFFSRHKNYPPELRRKELPLVDIADASATARRMVQYWPHPRGPKQTSS